MNTEATAELIWHFAGYLHLTEDYSASRLKYEEISFHARSSVYSAKPGHHDLPKVDLPELSSHAIRVSYSPRYGSSDGVSELKLPEIKVDNLTNIAAPSPLPSMVELGVPTTLGSSGGIPQMLGQYVQGEASAAPVYTIDYNDELGSQHAQFTQLNVMVDRDYFSDGGEPYSELQHVPTGEAIPDMLDAAHEFIPDLFQQAGTAANFWAEQVAVHDEAIASGEMTGEVLALGRYVNGELQEEGSSTPEARDPIAPMRPEREEGDSDPGQVAELGGNTAQNIALIADMNEAPGTLIVMGDYYETNAIIQANVLQNEDQVLESGNSPSVSILGGDNRTDNIATFAAQQVAAQVAAQQVLGDLHVNIDVVDGDLFDIKALTQRNYIDDGDVSVQTQYNAYSQVVSGGNEQANAAKFVDWGKHYDVIIVLGDYHSANIISQTNILLDNDVVGVGAGTSGSCGASGGGDSESSVYMGQNDLLNEASISKYGATTFAGITGDLEDLIAAIGNQDTLDANAWSSFHGAATGSLNVLFVTGNYYDLNIISQINVIADADLAVQVNGGSGLQWLSVGGNSAINSAEIINAGGIYNQYLGGAQYEDSVLVQANLVSDATHTDHTNPAALVPELVAFLDQTQDDSPSNGETWTSSTYSNHDTFGHMLT